jgi:hypothetical protein
MKGPWYLMGLHSQEIVEIQVNPLLQRTLGEVDLAERLTFGEAGVEGQLEVEAEIDQWRTTSPGRA